MIRKMIIGKAVVKLDVAIMGVAVIIIVIIVSLHDNEPW